MAKVKAVVKILQMIDEKSRKKALEVISGIDGVEKIESDLKAQTITVTGAMDPVLMAVKLKKKLGNMDLVSVGPS